MIKRILTRLLIAGAGAVLLAFGIAYLVPLPARLTAPPSTVVTFEDGTPAFVFLSPDDKYRMEVRLDEVDPDYVTALLRFEDKRFHLHHIITGSIRIIICHNKTGKKHPAFFCPAGGQAVFRTMKSPFESCYTGPLLYKTIQ